MIFSLGDDAIDNTFDLRTTSKAVAKIGYPTGFWIATIRCTRSTDGQARRLAGREGLGSGGRCELRLWVYLTTAAMFAPGVPAIGHRSYNYVGFATKQRKVETTSVNNKQ